MRQRMLDGSSGSVLALVASCFLLTSVGYLSWLYRLMDVVALEYVDVHSMVVGYLLQAVGVGVYARAARGREATALRGVALGAVVLYALCLVPALLAPTAIPVLVFGGASNLLCGVVSGFYLHVLARLVPSNRRGTVFGLGYGMATVGGWLLSLPRGGALLQTRASLGLCAVLAIVAAVCVARLATGTDRPAAPRPSRNPSAGETLALAVATVFLMCLVKNLGNGFPASDIDSGVSVELSRLVYAFSLVIAGVVSDRSRSYGLLCCMAALVMPFVTLSLASSSALGGMLWALGYFFFGFFSVFRVVLFGDLATLDGRYELASWGLMVGRAGDAVGTLLCIALGAHRAGLVALAALLFAPAVFLTFQLHQRVYQAEGLEPQPAEPDPAPAPPEPRSERQLFEEFCAAHEVTARERDVLRLLLDERSNAEIAGQLVVSEGTVKFHVRNLLRKTGCKNRLELIAAYVRETGL